MLISRYRCSKRHQTFHQHQWTLQQSFPKAEKKCFELRVLYLDMLSIICEGKIHTFSYTEYLINFTMHAYLLKKLLKDVFQKMKGCPSHLPQKGDNIEYINSLVKKMRRKLERV